MISPNHNEANYNVSLFRKQSYKTKFHNNAFESKNFMKMCQSSLFSFKS